MTFKTVLMLGAGFMGTGITQTLVQNGRKVYLWDVSKDYISKAQENVKARLDRKIEKGELTEAKVKEMMDNIIPITEISEVEDVDLVIEAVIEDEDIKKDTFKKCYETIGEDCVYASNTSALSISTLSTAIPCPDKFIGLHFFSPVPVMKLVEIVKGLKTSDETAEKCKTFISEIGKTGVFVKDGPGFLVNRVMHAFRNEVYNCLEEGVASVEDIDTAVKLGLGHPMGPFELNDYAGLDIGYATSETLYENFKDPKWKPNLTVKHMIEAGELGRKTGKGWYDYTSGEKEVRDDINF